MKKFLFLSIILSLFFASCGKDEFLPPNSHEPKEGCGNPQDTVSQPDGFSETVLHSSGFFNDREQELYFNTYDSTGEFLYWTNLPAYGITDFWVLLQPGNKFAVVPGAPGYTEPNTGSVIVQWFKKEGSQNALVFEKEYAVGEMFPGIPEGYTSEEINLIRFIK